MFGGKSRGSQSRSRAYSFPAEQSGRWVALIFVLCDMSMATRLVRPGKSPPSITVRELANPANNCRLRQ